MAEASLVFPICCLTFSFVFVILFYNASIRERAGALHRDIILPTRAWIERNLFTQSNEAIAISEPAYEVITLEKNDEIKEEPQPSPERPWFFPRPQSRYREASMRIASPSPSPDYHAVSMGIPSPCPSPDARNPSHTRQARSSVFFDDRMLLPSSESESYEEESEDDQSTTFSEFTTGSEDVWESDDSYEPDSEIGRPSGSRSMVYRPSSEPIGLPDVWHYELEQPIYRMNSAGTSALLERVVSWTAQTAFVRVAPPAVLEAMDERYEII